MSEHLSSNNSIDLENYAGFGHDVNAGADQEGQGHDLAEDDPELDLGFEGPNS